MLLLLRSTAGFSPCCQLMLMMPSLWSSLCTLTASPLIDSKQLVSARLTLSYHNLIILMILLLNLRRCTCIHPEGSYGWTHLYESHMSLRKCEKGYNIQWCNYPCVFVCRNVCACVLVCHFPQTNTTQQHGPQPCCLTQTTGRLWKTISIKQASALSVKHQSQRGCDCGVSSSPIELSGLI